MRIPFAWLVLSWVSVVAARPGPAADYDPLALVRTHVHARELSAEFIDKLQAIAGKRHQEVGDPGAHASLVWLRDYQPIYIRDAADRPLALRVRSNLPERNGVYFLGDPPAIDLPIVHENGNLLVVGHRLLVSTRLLSDNKVEGPGAEAARRPLLRDLAQALAVREENIIIMPQLPGESTGHVDLYLLPLSDNHILVSRVPEAALVDLTETEWNLGRTVATFLDEQAGYLASLGLKVGRLDMLPPRILPSIDNSTEDAVFFSASNALLLNIEGRKSVLLPDFDPASLRAAHRPLFRQFRKQWVSTFQAAGWKPVFADATEMSRYLGFFRCLSAVVPE